MDTVTFDETDALCGLRAAVAEKGADYKYEPPAGGPQYACVYVWETDGTLAPRCIVGYALHHMGVPLELLRTPMSNGTAECGSDGPDEDVRYLAQRLQPHGYVLTEGAVRVLQAAQNVQDEVFTFLVYDNTRDVTWGAALKAAEEAAAHTARAD